MSANWRDVVAQIRDLQDQHRAEKAKVKELCERIVRLEDGIRATLLVVEYAELSAERLRGLLPDAVVPPAEGGAL